MKNFLYLALLYNSMPLQAEESIVMFAQGLRKIANESVTIKKEGAKTENTIDTSIEKNLLDALNKNDYTTILNAFEKKTYRVNDLKNWTLENNTKKNEALAKILMTMYFEKNLNLKSLALGLITTYKENDAIDFTWSYGKENNDNGITETPLLVAVNIEDIDIVNALLTKGANPLKITQSIHNQQMPLTQAIDKNNDSTNKKIILALIEKVTANTIDTKIQEYIQKDTNKIEISYNETTPLLKAVSHYNLDVEIVHALLEKGANPLYKTINYSNKKDIVYKDEKTPLTVILEQQKLKISSKKQNIKTIILALINKINKDINTPIINTTDKQFYVSWPPLEYAVATENIDVVNALLEKGANPTSEIKIFYSFDKEYVFTPLISSLSNNYNQDIATALINKSKDIDSEEHNPTSKLKTTPLLLAINKNDLTNTKLLLQKGADPLKMVAISDETKKAALYEMLYKLTSNSTSISDDIKNGFKEIILEILTAYKTKNQPIDKNTQIFYKNFDDIKTIKDMLNKIHPETKKEILNFLK